MLPARPAHRRLSFATVLLFGVGPIVTARYADAAGDGLSSVRLAGSPNALTTAAGMFGPLDRWRVMTESVRHLYGAEVSPERLETFRVYLTTINVLRRTWHRAAPDGSLRLPQGPAAPAQALVDAVEALGFRITRSSGRVRFVSEPDWSVRRGHLTRSGADLDELMKRLDAGEAVTWPLDTTVTLPLDGNQWRRVFGDATIGDDALAAAILADRRAALLYFGLVHAGRGTLTAVGESPELLEAVAEQAPRFAAFSSSISIVERRVVTPGGAELPQSGKR